MNRILFLAATIVGFVSCSETDIDQLTPEQGGDYSGAMRSVSINATLDSESESTRLALNNDWSLTWESGDALMAWSDTESDTKTKLTTGDSFDKDLVVFSGTVAEDSPFRLLYPYAEGASIVDGKYTIDLTSQSDIAAGSSYMINDSLLEDTTSESYSVIMRQLGAVLVLKLGESYANTTFTSVEVSGVNSGAVVDLTKSITDPDLYVEYTSEAITIDGVSTADAVDGYVEMKLNIMPTTLSKGDLITVTITINDSSTTYVYTYEGDESVELARATYNSISKFTQEDDYWTTYAADSFAVGNGSQETPYEISTAEELALIAKSVNAGDATYDGEYFKLTANIDLSGHEWVAVGYSSKYLFKGTFDGDNKKILGLYINKVVTTYNDGYQGLFGYISGATISNLTVSGSVTTTGEYSSMYTAGIVGYAANTSTSTITNCTNSVSVSGGGIQTGGVAGYLLNANISGCANTASVTGSGTCTGGVVGYVQIQGEIAGAFTIDNSTNSGAILGSGDYVGGVVGCVYIDGYSGATMTITNATNSGMVTGRGVYASVDNYKEGVGGVVGTVLTIDDGVVTLDNCSNSGAVVGAGENIGGVVGLNYSSGEISLTGCYNSASIEGASTKVGGVVGYNYITTNKETTLTDCYNTGSVSGCQYVGGVVGYIYCLIESTTTIDGCYDRGGLITNRSSTSNGGVVGCICNSGGEMTISESYSENSSLEGSGLIGGLIGCCDIKSDNFEITIDKCYSRGLSISDTSGVAGGLIGSVYFATSVKTPISIANCYSECSINAPSWVGGLFGEMTAMGSIDSKLATIANCYTIGSLEATAEDSYLGGLVGGRVGNSAVNNFEFNNCYSANTLIGSKYVGGIFGHQSYASPGANIYWDKTLYDGDACGDYVYSEPDMTGVTTTDMQSEAFVETLNANREESTELCEWVYNAGGYPTFNF